MNRQIIGITFILAISVLSKLLYKHKGAPYAKNREKADIDTSTFKRFDPYLRVTTAVVGIGSYLSESPAFLKIPVSEVLFLIGLLVGTLGFAIFLLAKYELKLNYSPCFDAYLPHSIVKTGIYSWVRHPIYTGNLTLFAGLFLMTGSLWILFNFIILAYFYNKSARIEEKVLSDKLIGYKEYMSKTSRYIPFI